MEIIMKTKFGNISLEEANQLLKEKDPLEIIEWVLLFDASFKIISM